MLTEQHISFRRRFVKDFNLPINLVDDPFFSYYMCRYDIFPTKEYNDICQKIITDYDGNINKWIECYSQIRDNIITTIENSEAYKKFINIDYKNYKMPQLPVGDMNIYNNSNTGGDFISIDLKKANFQTLKWFDDNIVLGCDSYDDLMDKFGGDDYFKKSKYTRQVIFGKLNPKRTIYFEKYLMSTIINNKENVTLQFLLNNAKLLTIKSDEIVFKVNESLNIFNIDVEFLENIKNEIKTNHNLDVSVEYFHLSRIVTKNHNGGIVDGYRKYIYYEYKYELKNVSSIFYPQIYAFSNDLPLEDLDLYFKAEDQIAKFVNPLELIKIED